MNEFRSLKVEHERKAHVARPCVPRKQAILLEFMRRNRAFKRLVRVKAHDPAEQKCEQDCSPSDNKAKKKRPIHSDVAVRLRGCD